MSRRRWVYNKEGDIIAEYAGNELVSAAPEFYTPTDKSAMVMPDIQPYKSMIDGSMITSRSQHRAHLREHRMIEIGNETKHLTKQRETVVDPRLKESRREALAAALDRHRR